jgi:cell wall-associated NlpC family hydrolase
MVYTKVLTHNNPSDKVETKNIFLSFLKILILLMPFKRLLNSLTVLLASLIIMVQPSAVAASNKTKLDKKPSFQGSKKNKSKNIIEGKSKSGKANKKINAKKSKSKSVKSKNTAYSKVKKNQSAKINKSVYSKGNKSKTAKANKAVFSKAKKSKSKQSIHAKRNKHRNSKKYQTKNSEWLKSKYLESDSIQIADASQSDEEDVEARLYEEAEKLLGIPYRPGGAGLRGTDCSGLTRQIYASLFGINIPHNSRDQNRLPFLKNVTSDDLQPGDLIFWGPGKKRINHVGIYLADGKFLHASRTSGVTISSFSDRYWQNRFIGSKRVKGLASYADSIRAASQLEEDIYVPRDQIFEVGYNTTLFSDITNLKIGAFMEFNHGEAEANWDYVGLNPSYRSYDMDFRKGAWVSTQTRIMDWLAISPSLGYVDGYSSLYEKDGTRQILGLGAQMSPLNSRWSLIMSAAYSTMPDEPLEWSTLYRSDWKMLDMTFGFSYTFTDLLRLSVTGTRTGQELDNSQQRLNEQLRLDDILFRFDLGF